MRWIISIFFASIIIAALKMSAEQSEYPTSAGKEVMKILNMSARRIEIELPLNACGQGAAMPGGDIQKLCLSFNTKSVMNIEELRKLLIKTSNYLLENINNAVENNKLLSKNLFNIKNIQIIIFNLDKTGRESYYPNIATAQISEGILSFSTLDTPENYALTDQLIENYDEALKLACQK